MYHHQDGEGIFIIILYVNDITLLGNKIDEIKGIKSMLASCYKMTDLGEIDSYLGVQIICNRSIKHLEIDQSHYILEIINHFRMADVNSACTPLPAGAEVYLIKYNGKAATSEIKYFQQIIGSLLYIQIDTCLDISFAVSCLTQYAANPLPQHAHLAKYVLSYLKGMADLCLCYDGAQGMDFMATQTLVLRMTLMIVTLHWAMFFCYQMQ